MTTLLKATLVALPLALGAANAAHAAIVNIQGYSDNGSTGAGANIYAYPVQPGTPVSLANPVLLTFDAGDYLISGAWGQNGALYDAWNFQRDVAGSWASHYVVAASNDDGGYTLLLDAGEAGDPACTYHFCGWLTREQARDQFLATAPVALHLSKRTELAFASADYALSDNLGGISLSVVRVDVNAVPEPQTYALMLAGLVGIGAVARRRSAAPAR